jgi:uncharacterized membrane protein YidH (DUF202 family)
VTSGRLFDEGAALERTQMAWVRTGLGLLATSAIAVRLMLDASMWLAAAVAMAGGFSAVALLSVAQRRYRVAQQHLWAADSASTIGVRSATAAVRGATCAVLVLSGLLAVSVAVKA